MGKVKRGRSCKRRGACRLPLVASGGKPYSCGRASASRYSAAARPHDPASRLVAGEPPAPVPLGRAHQASGGRVPATRCRGHPQHQARGQPFPHSRHGSCGDNFRAGPDAPRRHPAAATSAASCCLLCSAEAVAASPRSCRTLRFPSPARSGGLENEALRAVARKTTREDRAQRP